MYNDNLDLEKSDLMKESIVLAECVSVTLPRISQLKVDWLGLLFVLSSAILNPCLQ